MSSVGTRVISEKKVLSFDIAGRAFCVDVGGVEMVTSPSGMEMSVSSGPYQGWIMFRNKAVAVFNLYGYLGGDEDLNSESSQVIIFKSSEPWGIKVDDIPRVLEPEGREPLALGETSPFLSECCNGRLETADQTLLYLNPSLLFDLLTTSRGKGLIDGADNGEGADSSPLGEQKRILLFTPPKGDFGGESPLFALSVKQLLHSSDPLPITSSGGGKKHFVGSVIWSGTYVPVMDLGRLLGKEKPTAAGADKFLFVRSSQSIKRAAIPVGAERRIKTLPMESKPVEGKTDIDAWFARGVYETPEGLVYYLDIEKLVQ